MNKGFYNRVMTSNRVLHSNKHQPVVQPAKINNGEKLQYVSETKNVEQNVIEQSSSLLVSRIESLEELIHQLQNKNVEIENRLNELLSKNTESIELKEFNKVIVNEEEIINEEEL